VDVGADPKDAAPDDMQHSLSNVSNRKHVGRRRRPGGYVRLYRFPYFKREACFSTAILSGEMTHMLENDRKAASTR
jgi:hypothetical protein